MAANNPITKVIIPVSPHVRKYLASRPVFGSFTFNLNKDHYIGRILFHMLSKPPVKVKREPLPKCYITVKIPFRWENLYTKIYISGEGAREFDAIIDGIIKDEAIKLLAFADYNYETKKKILEDFYEKYDLSDEDIAFDTLMKQYQRKADLHKMPDNEAEIKISPQMSS